MKTSNPLAAALLLIAASASAQPLAGGYNFGGGQNTTPFSLGAASGPVDDIVFKCGTVPYIACTAEHMNKRENIRITGICPAPASAACTAYLMSTRGAANPVETIAAYDPPPDMVWADPRCQQIPCRVVPRTDEIVVTGRRRPAPTDSGLPYDQQPGFIGPPAPPRNQGPQPFTDETAFRQAMREQENLTPGKVVDLGNNTYAVDTGDGNYSIGGLCNGAPCNGMPKRADEIPGLADALQLANSLNNGNKSGFGPTSTQTPPAGSGRTSQGTPDVASTPSSEAQNSGGDAGSLFRSNGGGRGAPAGGTSGSGYAATAASSEDQVIKTAAADLDDIRLTHIKTQEIQKGLDATEKSVAGGMDGTFATPGASPDANAGDLKFRGTQSEANR